MHRSVWVDDHLCRSCTKCPARAVCRTRALVQIERDDLPVVETARCRGCLVCMPACPYGAIRNDHPIAAEAPVIE